MSIDQSAPIAARWLFRSIATIVATCSLAVHAQSFPESPIKLVVPYSAGGGADRMARAVAQKLGERLGTSVFVDNRPGADALVGTSFAVNAKPDGYTILSGDSSVLTLLPAIRKLNFDPRDLIVVGPVAALPYVFVISTKLGVKTLPEFLKLAKASPNTLNYASSSSMTELGMEMLKSRAGIDVVKIPYPGAAQGINSMLAGQTSMYFLPPLSAKPYIDAGQMIAIAAATPTRLSVMPDVPTFAELGYPGLEVLFDTGLFVPHGTPPQVVTRLNQALTQVMSEPGIQKAFDNEGALIIQDHSAEAFATVLEKDRGRWQRVAHDAGLSETDQASSK